MKKIFINNIISLVITGSLLVSCGRSREISKTLPGEQVAIASYGEILSHLDQVVKYDKSKPADMLDASFIAYHYKDYNSSQKFLDQYFSTGENAPAAYYLSACLDLKNGNTSEAIGKAKNAYYHGFTDYDLFNLMATAWYREKNLDSASWAVNIALDLYPSNPDALVLKGRILMAASDSAQALEFLEKGFALNPEQPGVLNEMVDIYSTLGKWDEAIDLLQEKLKESDNINLKKELVAIYLRLKKFNAADSLLASIPNQGNEFYKSLTLAGIFYDRYRLDSALVNAERALNVKPADREGRMMEGKILTRMGRYYDAYKTFNDLVTSDTSDIEAAHEFEHVKNILVYLNRINKFRQDSINRSSIQPLENIPLKKPGF